MKKILLATSILVGTAGVAAADVNISGGARFGVALAGGTWSLTNRFTLNFDGSGETDGGLEYGGRVRLRATNFGAASLSGANAYIGANGFRLSVGNVNGAIEMMPGLYSNGVGLTGLGWNGVWANHSTSMWGWQAFSSAGAGVRGVAADYSMGDLGVHASYDVTNSKAAISASYAFGDWTAALGIQSVPGASLQDFVVVGVSGSFGDFGVNASYASFNAGAASKWTIGGKYSMNDITVNAFYSGEDATGVTSYGIGAAYNLGGATVAGGVAVSGGATTADLGVKISF